MKKFKVNILTILKGLAYLVAGIFGGVGAKVAEKVLDTTETVIEVVRPVVDENSAQYEQTDTAALAWVNE